MLTADEIRLILSKINPKFGYSDVPEIARLEAKLSIMLQAAVEKEHDHG